MTTPPPRRLEDALARALTVGIALAAAVIALGLALHAARHAADPVALHTYQPQPPSLRGLSAAFQALPEPRAIIQVGLALLILTPALRVLTALIVFAAQRRMLYVALSALVLALLTLGLVGLGH